MFADQFDLMDRKELYIRLPKNLQDKEELTLTLPGELAGKTLKIVAVENEDTPYECDEVYADSESKALRYYGDEEYWKPCEYVHTVVKGNPDCDYAECTYECQVVSCAVHQGYASDAPLELRYVRSEQLRK